MSPRLRRGIALGAIALATGGLVLYRSPGVQAFAGDAPSVSHALIAGKNSATFQGPGAHGMISLSHTHVLEGTSTPVFAEVNVIADASDTVKQRAPIAMAVVLDTSGSMSGEKIQEARRAVLKLIADMHDDDEITVIRYSDSSDLVQPLARVGAVRDALSSRIRSLDAGGGTNIPSGLQAGLRALDESTAGRVRRIVLVSDGLDTTRAAAEQLARSSFTSGITVSSLGIGVDFDESYMGSLAQNGHGNFGFVKDGASLARFLHRELEETAFTTVENMRVRLHLDPGVSFVSATGADARVDGNDVVLSIGSLFAGDERRVIVSLTANRQHPIDIAYVGGSVDAEATWNPVGSGSIAQAKARSLMLSPTRSASEVESGRDGAVFASAASVVASRRQIEASKAYADGNVGLATALTEQNERDLRKARDEAPVAAAPAIAMQLGEYADMKKGFAHIRPGSAEGRAAAKANTESDLGNLTRAKR